MDERVYEISVHGKDGQPARPVILWADPLFRHACGDTELNARLDRARSYGHEATYREVAA
jgi:hypothetical protein